MTRSVETPTLAQLLTAHARFNASEPRELFYRLATATIDNARQGGGTFSLPEGIAILLLSWNRRFYVQRRRNFGQDDLDSIASFVEVHKSELDTFHRRDIRSFGDADEAIIVSLFNAAVQVCGRTGAAKALHLLAPRFFPIWDSIIAPKAYGLFQRGPRDYLRLMTMTQEQVLAVLDAPEDLNLVKAIDEWNYCRFTLGLTDI